ncbi:MAG: sulfatase-like hydrolase/transferase [Akkermansiaceae bacterium]|nr:sulfatase-like hydrolase/transferase [Akkermansiaceae bacterium]
MRFLALFLALVSLLPAAEKPNILFIFADDMTYEAIGSLGMTEVKTPNLDKLFASGTQFTHAYNSGGWNGAICVASRNMMMTGRYLWHAQREEKTMGERRLWPQLMSDAGYTTYMTGKWHVRMKADQLFDHVGDVRPGMPNQVKAGYNRPLKGKEDPWDPTDKANNGFWKGGKHWSEVEADTAVKFLNMAKKDTKPFFFYLAFNAPHDPRQSPQKYLDMYPVDKIKTPENYLDAYPHRKVMKAPHSLRDEKLAPMPRTEHSVKVARREYFALITHMDAQIGRVLETLEKNGQRENTYIVFTADHGLGCGRHGLLGKQNMYDHSVRVPYVVVGPEIDAGKTISSPIYIQDSVPTALQVAGAGVPGHIQYQSYIPVLKGESEGRPHIYNAYLKDAQRAMTKDGHKLILYPGGKIARLYNLKKDPFEKNDLLEKGKGKIIARKLFEVLKSEAKIHGDELEFGNYLALN